MLCQSFMFLLMLGSALSLEESPSTNETILVPRTFFNNIPVFGSVVNRIKGIGRRRKIMKGFQNRAGKIKSSSNEYIVVDTKYGTVEGKVKHIKDGKYFSFQGIPFAEPPVGKLRFKPPQPPKPWTGVRNALSLGSQCLQMMMGYAVGKEDCLYINVYTPELPKKGEPLKAVMLWIYGGGFQSGSGSIYFPDYFIKKDVVFITFNYRVNVLGFLSLNNTEASGNYGLKDQVQAMRWIQENIANFGGDPKRVTIFGESAGGASVTYHLLSPLSKGLFHQAIVQSGSALNPWAFTKTPRQSAVKLAQFLGSNASTDSELYNFFMGQKASDLASAGNSLFNKEMTEKSIDASFFSPTVEAKNSSDPFITQSPIEILLQGKINKVPLIIGTLNAEGIVIFSSVKYSDEDFKIMSSIFDWAVPLHWEIQSKEDRQRIGELVTKRFLKEKPVSKSNINSVVEIFSDTFFLLGIDQFITSFLKHSDTPIYNYEMVYEPVWSYIKIATTNKQGRKLAFKGAAHADELSLLFPLKVVKLSSKDQKLSDRMIGMWTSFAKKGNPNYSGMEVTWKKLEKGNRSYLEIGNGLKIKHGKIVQERIQFWEDLCKASSVNYTCVI